MDIWLAQFLLFPSFTTLLQFCAITPTPFSPANDLVMNRQLLVDPRFWKDSEPVSLSGNSCLAVNNVVLALPGGNELEKEKSKLELLVSLSTCQLRELHLHTRLNTGEETLLLNILFLVFKCKNNYLDSFFLWFFYTVHSFVHSFFLAHWLSAFLCSVHPSDLHPSVSDCPELWNMHQLPPLWDFIEL